MRKILIIFSGGQDSTTCLGWAKNRYDSVEAISFLYNQKHKIEIEQSKKITKKLNIKHTIIDVSFYANIVDSELVKNGDINKKHERLNLPASYVPNRNSLFIILAHSYAQKNDIKEIALGVCETDYSGYPDCRQEYITQIEKALNIGSQSEIKIITPLMKMNKKQIWKMAEKEGIFEIVKNISHTCYNGNEECNEWGKGCGECPACKLRKRGYEEYVSNKEEI